MGAKNSSHDRASTSKLQERMVQAITERAQKGKPTHKTFNSIILKFPEIDESFETVRAMFKKFDVDGSGTIDLQELKGCFQELGVKVTDEEMKAFYTESDLDRSQGIDFKEFIVLLALVYFLGSPFESSSSKEVPSRIGLPRLEATFETIVEAFIFFDANRDGYLSKKEMIEYINRVTCSRHADRVGVKRFEEMDWDKNGLVTFKEFLFAFMEWVGLEEYSDDGSRE